MIESASGLVLRTRPLTETSLIVHWLTPGFGRVATAAKGARRPKSPFLGKLDLFYEADFTFSRSRSSDLHTLREVNVRKMHPALRQEIRCLQPAAFCARLVEQATETETPLPAVYELMRGLLDHLDSPSPLSPAPAGKGEKEQRGKWAEGKRGVDRPSGGPAPFPPFSFSPFLLCIFAFELKLLNEFGLKPDLEKSRLTLGAKQIVKAFLASDWTAISRLRLSEAQLTELRQFLHGFLIFHLGRIPKGRLL